MAVDDLIRLRNGKAIDRSQCPVISMDTFRQEIIEGLASGFRLSALFVDPAPVGHTRRLYAILSMPDSNDLGLLVCEIGHSYPSLTRDCPSAHWFEREIAEQWNIIPEGHPWLKPIRFQPPRFQSGSKEPGKPTIGVTDFFSMTGEEIHEVAVGPVHAGVIEPGHFRFQCQGETVHHLEISLGYQHRGVERALIGGPSLRTLPYMETLAGDSTIGHTSAYCRAIEALARVQVSARAEVLRSIAAELERLANHIGDLGALAGDVGFLPTMSYCGRIRGDVLNLTALLCGNRFGRGMIVPGGLAYDLDDELITLMLSRLDEIEKDTTSAIDLLFNTPSVLARFEGTGNLPAEVARSIGLVGVAARACGIRCDVRHDFPYGFYQFKQMLVCTWPSGDCFARAYVRWLEVQQSFDFVREQIQSLPAGTIRKEIANPGADQIVVTLSEGWRGEICHVVTTDSRGCFSLYKVIDPSFHNWFGLAYTLREQQISDFPLCNKSFNLSYCGHDL